MTDFDDHGRCLGGRQEVGPYLWLLPCLDSPSGGGAVANRVDAPLLVLELKLLLFLCEQARVHAGIFDDLAACYGTAKLDLEQRFANSVCCSFLRVCIQPLLIE